MKAITTKTEITQATIARGKDKVTHETFYVVRCDSCETTWYTVRWNNERLLWCCNCPAKCNGCKHSRAVNEVLKIRRLAAATAMGPGAVETVKRWQAEEDAKLAEQARKREAFVQEFSIYE